MDWGEGFDIGLLYYLLSGLMVLVVRVRGREKNIG